MEKNTKLLNDTLAFIKANPKLHNQGDWIDPGEYEADYQPCSTTMCFAGHAAMLAGATFDKDIWFDEYGWDVDAETGKHTPFCDSENLIHVSSFAGRKLGLDDSERQYLFSASRSIQEIEEAVDMFSRGYSVTWDGEFYESTVD